MGVIEKLRMFEFGPFKYFPLFRLFIEHILHIFEILDWALIK